MWYVTIYNCDGKPLEGCGKKYVVLPAKCGHLEVEVPQAVTESTQFGATVLWVESIM
jgi:hypothetical protein